MPPPESGTNQIRIVSSSGHHTYQGLTTIPTHLPSLMWPQKKHPYAPPHAPWTPDTSTLQGLCSWSYPLSLLHRECLPSLEHFYYVPSPRLLISFKLMVSGLHFPSQQKFLKELSIQAIAISSFSSYPQFTPVGFPSVSCHYSSFHKVTNDLHLVKTTD